MGRSLYARLSDRFAADRSNAFTRRQMLKASAAAGAGLLLSNCTLPRSVGNMLRSRRVLVVGAGFAGLACAYELMSAGYDVSVYEARDRIGGRVRTFTDFLPGHAVEGGGELIGSNHPTWAAYKEKFQLEFSDVSEDKGVVAPIVVQGERLDDADAKKLWEDMTVALKTMTEDARDISEDAPWESEDAAGLDARTTAAWLKDITATPLVKDVVEAQLVGNNGCPLDHQSYLGNLAQVKGGGLEKYWTDSEVYRCKGGNQQLAKKLVQAIGSSRVRLNLPVVSIAFGSETCNVQTADDKYREFDDVVLAVPPSVWSKIRFAPDLPATLHPQMGVNIKALALLGDRFWTAAKQSPNALTDGPVAETWEATDGQNLSDVGGHAVLTAFAGGPGAQQCMDSPHPLQFIRGEIAKTYPGITIPFLTGRFMSWPREEWTMASYSFPAPGQVTVNGPVLAKGMERMYFAGEHCCYKFVGYMEGALSSGVSVARKIAKRDGVAMAHA